MSSRRVLKVAEAIREVVSMAILIDLRDPRISDVTVTRVNVSGDLRLAKVYVSVMGDEKKQDLCMHGLNHSTGYLQRKVGDRVDTRFTPKLQFVLDKGVKHSMAVAQILNQVLEDPAENQIEDSQIDPASDIDGLKTAVTENETENTAESTKSDDRKALETGENSIESQS